MRKLALHLTRGAKQLGLSILTLGSSVLIAACYGAQYAGQQISLITGMVRGQGQGVGGIQVCLNTVNAGACATTDDSGHYQVLGDEHLETTVWEQGGTLQVRDVDGAENGDYAAADVSVPAETVPTVIDVDLDPAVN